MRIDPSAATSATALPEISAKNIEAEMLTIDRPPRMNPNTADAKATSRREIPDRFMIAPARMKSGIAIRGNLVAPENIRRPALGSVSTPPETRIATTVISPSATAMGIDPVHFGLIVTLNLGIGQQTPPVASVLVTACSVAKADIWKVTKANLWFIGVLLAILLLVTYVPAFSLALVELFYR